MNSEEIGGVCASVLGELNAQLKDKPEEFQATVVRALTEILTAQLKHPEGQRVIVRPKWGENNVFVMAQECEVGLDALAAYLHATAASNPAVEWGRSLFLKLCKVGDAQAVFVWQDSVQALRAELEDE